MEYGEETNAAHIILIHTLHSGQLEDATNIWIGAFLRPCGQSYISTENIKNFKLNTTVFIYLSYHFQGTHSYGVRTELRPKTPERAL